MGENSNDVTVPRWGRSGVLGEVRGELGDLEEKGDFKKGDKGETGVLGGGSWVCGQSNLISGNGYRIKFQGNEADFI